MSRVISVASLAAIVLLATSYLVAQDTAAPKTAAKPCDLAKVEKGLYCDACKAILATADLKEGMCAKCGAAPRDCEVCVKTCYACKMCNTTQCEAKCSKCGMELKDGKVVNALVIWKCPKCGATANKAGECSGTKCEHAKMEKTCDHSGTCPHIGK